MKITIKNQIFIKNLLLWNLQKNIREMPWKGEKDPYKIWLSEIILQQTRVEQGLDYYNKFIKTFPSIFELANASDTTIFKLWEGLGYYTRCKNLIATAKFISQNLKGIFPNTYHDILKLKGIGPYTAAAIASFAFNLPYAVVDGNVFRVLARYFGIIKPIDSTKGKQAFTLLANDLLDKKKPAIYNQALMDFGAVICKPQIPLCSDCMLNVECVAFNKSIVSELPVKQKKITRKNRWFYYLIIEYKNKLYVRKRGPKDIWENLYEFVLMETNTLISLEKINDIKAIKELFANNSFEVQYVSAKNRQLLTHQIIHGQFIKIITHTKLTDLSYKALSLKEIYQLPFPKFIAQYLKDKNLSLNLF